MSAWVQLVFFSLCYLGPQFLEWYCPHQILTHRHVYLFLKTLKNITFEDYKYLTNIFHILPILSPFTNIILNHFIISLTNFYFLLDIFFIYISNVIPFPSFPSKIPYLLPLSHCSPTHPLPLPGPGIPLYLGIEPSQD